MDCWNFCISHLLSNENIEYKESDFIFSEIFSWVSLLPKIWITLLEYSNDIEIIHENEDIFINLQDDEIPLLNEYKNRLNKFIENWWKYINTTININLLKEKLNNYSCIIPIKKGEWSHLVILSKINKDIVTLIDNKKWEYPVSIEEFENLIELHNWKYVLNCKFTSIPSNQYEYYKDKAV